MPRAPEGARSVGRRKYESRLKRYIDSGESPPVPESPLPYLTDLLFEIGPDMPGGFGPAALSEQEIAAWQFNRRIRLTAWETRVLRDLSRDFVKELARAESPDAEPPFVEGDIDLVRARVASKIEDFFG